MMFRGQSGTSVLLAAIAIGFNAQSSHPQTEGPPPDDVLLILAGQSAGERPDGWCRLSVEADGRTVILFRTGKTTSASRVRNTAQ